MSKSAPTKNFVEGPWSFRASKHLYGVGFSVYPKGERSHWAVKANIYPASDNKCWVISMTGYQFDARSSFDEAKELVLSRLGPTPQRKDYRYTEENCPTKHWNDGTDVCGDCGAELNA